MLCHLTEMVIKPWCFSKPTLRLEQPPSATPKLSLLPTSIHSLGWRCCVYKKVVDTLYVSGFPWNKGNSPTKPPFGVRSCEVAIIWPDVLYDIICIYDMICIQELISSHLIYVDLCTVAILVPILHVSCESVSKGTNLLQRIRNRMNREPLCQLPLELAFCLPVTPP